MASHPTDHNHPPPFLNESFRIHPTQFGHQGAAVDGQVVGQVGVGDGDMDERAVLTESLCVQVRGQLAADRLLLEDVTVLIFGMNDGMEQAGKQDGKLAVRAGQHIFLQLLMGEEGGCAGVFCQDKAVPAACAGKHFRTDQLSFCKVVQKLSAAVFLLHAEIGCAPQQDAQPSFRRLPVQNDLPFSIGFLLWPEGFPDVFYIFFRNNQGVRIPHI